MKKTLGIILIIVLMFSIVGCGGSTQDDVASNEEMEPILIKLGHAVPPTNPYHLGAEKFVELVEERTNGKVTFEIFHSGQLGNERDMIEGLQLETVDMVISSTGPMGGFEPKMMIADLPFIFRDREHAYKVLDGEIGTELLDSLESKSIIGLAFWENGFRNLTNSQRPIETPEDIAGLKIRTMENQVHMDSFRQLGADPTPMAWSEVFTSLQQGVIDGQENPIPVIYSSKIYEVQNYLAITEHFYSPAVLLMSKSTYDKLDEETQQIIRDTAKEVASYERDLVKQMEDEQVSELEALGMVITRPDKAALQEAVKPIYEQYESQFTKEFIDKVINTK